MLHRLIDHTHGGVQILNGRIYYSPNSCRFVEEPPFRSSVENPFVPFSDASSPRNIMDLDIRDYMCPQWWTRPWGWISFFWSNLDNQLNVITYFLQSHFEAPAIRPMNPWAFGYKKVFPCEAMMMRAIMKSWEWFSVWVALLSFLIAQAEVKEEELKPYPYLAKKNWAAFFPSPMIPEADSADSSSTLDVSDTQGTVSTHQEHVLSIWQKFSEARKVLTQRMEQTETERQRQTRLDRARKPPTKSAKVFRWVKDDVTNIYIREQVSKKWREDTLGDYSAKQTRYDSFLNEYDCCSAFGSDDESDENDEDD
ncbi:hypothetical protein HYPSUDRAFT_151668, partial [Hypholoma sublateritium FD-334 SS-4]